MFRRVYATYIAWQKDTNYPTQAQEKMNYLFMDQDLMKQ